MGLFGYTFRTFNRLRHGKGFGVHSPFAYGFIREVLRLPAKYAYYSYHEIDSWYKIIADRSTGVTLQLKYLKMIFRVGNYFRVRRALLVGEYEILPALAASTISNNTCVTVFDPAKELQHDTVIKGSERFRQIAGTPDLQAAFGSLAGDFGRPLIIINGDSDDLEQHLLKDEVRALEPVYIVIRLKRHRRIWERIQESYTDCGMSFSNPQVGVMVPDRKLPRQDFNIWI